VKVSDVRSRATLLGAVSVVAATWLVILPRVAEHPSVRQQRERQEALGINPEAMFYTDLDATETLILDWPTSTARDLPTP